MTPRYIIVIPVYNHPKTIIQVIRSCLLHSEFPILVVDDGSYPSVKDLIGSTELVGRLDRVHLYRHEINKGKGAALQSAFKWVIKNNFTHAITLDADGQHFPEDIRYLVKRSEEHPGALILGDREMSGPHIPGSSQFGKKFSNFWVQFETHQSVGDSQSGFRIYPLFHIQYTKFLSQHYDFEVEVITRLLWKNVKVENVKIQVQYQQGAERVTHFDKWKDNLRLTILNTLLVTISLLKNKKNTFLNSLSLAVGVLVGTTPFYGFHTLIIIILSLILRLNVPLMWVGTQVSLPPLIPFLITGTKLIYNSLFQSEVKINDYTQVLQLGSRWIYSSLIFGFILGGITFFIAYFLQKVRRHVKESAPSPKVWSKKSHSHLGIWFVQKLMEIAGIKWAYRFLYLIVPFYFLNPRIRKAMNEYWSSILPNLNYWQRQKRMFQQLLFLAQTLVDRAYHRSFSKQPLQMIKDENLHSFLEYLENPKNKRPCILVGTHFGGWELAMAAFDELQMNKRMLVIMHQSDHAQNHDSTTTMNREKLEVMYFNKSNFSILKIKEYLSRGDIVALMGDRPVGRSYELISFFERLCFFDSTAFRIAPILNAEIFYIFCVKEDILKYRISAKRSALAERSLPSLSQEFNKEPDSKGSVDDQLENNYNNKKKNDDGDHHHSYAEDHSSERQQRLVDQMREYTSTLENYVSHHPEQWMNFYPFFSTEPQNSIK